MLNGVSSDYAAKSWKVRWWLLDGWLALLFFVAFAMIAYLWRPSANNSRLLMSDELAQDEEDAEDYDLESLEHRTEARHRDDDEATLVGTRGPGHVGDDAVVFEIGDEDAHDLSDEEDDPHKHPRRRGTREHEEHSEDEDEREGLMSGGGKKIRDD